MYCLCRCGTEGLLPSTVNDDDEADEFEDDKADNEAPKFEDDEVEDDDSGEEAVEENSEPDIELIDSEFEQSDE
ncbi:hypothetical protein GBA52_019024 [Prunus armeniaca]|nr:hypothetical protein GBA52_019024 [Prunus armeniaca]